jgi:hypothetical protein
LYVSLLSTLNMFYIRFIWRRKAGSTWTFATITLVAATWRGAYGRVWVMGMLYLFIIFRYYTKKTHSHRVKNWIQKLGIMRDL